MGHITPAKQHATPNTLSSIAQMQVTNHHNHCLVCLYISINDSLTYKQDQKENRKYRLDIYRFKLWQNFLPTFITELILPVDSYERLWTYSWRADGLVLLWEIICAVYSTHCRGCFLTSSLIGTLALSLTIPLSIIADMCMQKVSIRLSERLHGEALGCILCCWNHGTNWN